MKIYVSADIEGVAGATHWDETHPDKPDYAEFREQMTAEVAAACEGAIEAGAEEVWVQDAHEHGRNILASKLPEAVRMIRGWSGHPLDMVQELDESFAAVCMIGYHSPSGSDANPLAHSMTTVFTRLEINGAPASEFLIHAYAAALLDVPVAFVSGDEGLCREVKAVNPAIGTLGVKRGVGNATVSLHPAVAVRRTRKGVAEAVGSDLTAARISLPERFAVEMAYINPAKATRSSHYPGARLKDAHTVCFETEDFFEVMRLFHFTL
ncbi:MAG: M55 family metallopeptidase [Planctomycetota bacterium]|jgi:D-amino peptidase